MKKLFLEQFISSVKSIAPITTIVLILSVILSNNDVINTIPTFLISALLLVFGMTLFDIGANTSMVEIGSKIGNHLTKKKNIPLILLFLLCLAQIMTYKKTIRALSFAKMLLY